MEEVEKPQQAQSGLGHCQTTTPVPRRKRTEYPEPRRPTSGYVNNLFYYRRLL